MKLAYLAYRNMVSKPLNLAMSLLLLLLSVSLVTFTFQLNEQLKHQLDKNIAPFDMVVGAKGSPLQLVLSSILHIDNPTGNIKLKEANQIKNHPFVKIAIPISYGDNYKGFRIVGTNAEFLNHYRVELLDGKMNQLPFEVVVGHHVANSLGLKIGDQFVGSHGLVDSGLDTHDEHSYMVTGILKPSGTVVDQLLITNLRSIWDSHDHDNHDEENHTEEHHHGDEDHDYDHKHEEDQIRRDEDKQITSLLVKFKNPMGMVQLPRFINEKTSMQAALPGYEIQRLMGLLGSGVRTINGIALAIFLVSGLSIFISILKTIRERKQELALLKTYGLSKFQLISLAFMEGLLLAFMGFVLGWFLGRTGVWSVSLYMQSNYGYGLIIGTPNKFELLLLVLILVLAMMASLLASLSIFKLNVAKTLSDG